MKKLIAIALFLPALALAQGGSIGGGKPYTPSQPATQPLPPLETNAWRGSGTGRSVMSRVDACRAARDDGNFKIQTESYRLSHRVIKGSSMGDCSCDGPAAGGWFTCMVDISITHSNR
jgi:hypothetical protein